MVFEKVISESEKGSINNLESKEKTMASMWNAPSISAITEYQLDSEVIVLVSWYQSHVHSWQLVPVLIRDVSSNLHCTGLAHLITHGVWPPLVSLIASTSPAT